MGEKVFASYICDKTVTLKIYKKLNNITRKLQAT